MKEDVEDLPEKEEVVIWVEMTPEQRKWVARAPLGAGLRLRVGIVAASRGRPLPEPSKLSEQGSGASGEGGKGAFSCPSCLPG
jgi:hypothetical protein